MATIFTHALLAVSAGQAGKQPWHNDWRFWYIAILCSIFPDVDVLGFAVGIHYGDLWGHRGMTHSLLFAAVVAVAMSFRFKLGTSDRWKMIALLFVITASHGMLDAMTNGGLGVAFFSPFDRERYFFPWTPIQVSPIGASGFFTGRGLNVIRSEIVWLWGPLVATGIVLYALTHWRAEQKSSTQRAKS